MEISATRSIVFGLALLLTNNTLAETNITLSIAHEQPGATINKNVYGQFVEHLGRGVYEGIWVGEDSNIPNTRGFRDDVISALKEINVPLLRWPGGCFADEYHWRNGIGPREKRPVTVNTNWGGVTDNNAFGTHEFFELADMLGADVYINGNLGTGTPREMAEWLEYMTSPSESTLANLRRSNGREEPWEVDFFAIGNESWGCGGTMTPEYYSDLYKRYASFLKTPEDNQPIMIASGGYNELTSWTEGLLKNIPEVAFMRMQAISHHYYTLPTGKWEAKGKAAGFDEQQWLSTFVNTLKIEDYIQANLKIMERLDPENKVGFYVDEWGTWYDPEEGDNPGFLYQQNTMRDALVAALNLNVFHNYAERVQMSIIAQMVNVLQAMILTDKEKMLLTPTYHVYKMYVPFQNAKALPVDLQGNPDYSLGELSAPQISASAAIPSDAPNTIVLALTNIHPRQSADIVLAGGWQSAKGEILTAERMDAYNTFNQDPAVAPQPYEADAHKDGIKLTAPPMSVMVVRLVTP